MRASTEYYGYCARCVKIYSYRFIGGVTDFPRGEFMVHRDYITTGFDSEQAAQDALDKEMAKAYVEVDYAGMGGYLRYTVCPFGTTLVQQPFYREECKLDLWKERHDKFLRALPPTAQLRALSGNVLGTVADAIGFDGYER